MDASEFIFFRKSTKVKSLIDELGIFHNNSCLLELRRGCYKATENAILLRDDNHAFSPWIEAGDHFYCCDFGKSLLKTIFSSPNFY